MQKEPTPNLVPRLTPEDIIDRDAFEEALAMDLECLGEEPSDDELIEDEKRRNRVESSGEKSQEDN